MGQRSTAPVGDTPPTRAALLHLRSASLLWVFMAICAAIPDPSCGRKSGIKPHIGQIGSRTGRSVETGRLSNSVLPVHYDLELHVFVENGTFKGQETIWLQSMGRTSNITLHASDLLVQEARLVSRMESSSGPLPSVHRLRFETDPQLLVIDLDRELTGGTEYGLFLRFAGNFSSSQTGLYRIQYADATRNNRWVAVTQFESTFARRVFPCFDEPAMKATFNLTVIRPVAMTTLSNTRRLVSVEREPGWIADQYESTVKMSTYLLAFAVCDFGFTEDIQSSNQVVRAWSRKEVVNYTNYIIDVAPKLLNYFEDFFNISYSLPKLDVVSVPDLMFHGMENWGLITLQEPLSLVDPERNSDAYKQNVASLVAHETAHQWFGNLVTMKWWDELWLKEAFATYMQYLGVEAIEPSWDMLSQFPYLATLDSMDSDSWNSSRPITSPVKGDKDISGMYDNMSYRKGAALLRMMDHFLSREIFQTGIITYLKALQYSIASQEELWKHLTVAAKNCTVLNHTTVEIVMDSWILQPGYPLVTVIRDYINQSAFISQSRFFFNKQAQANDKVRWNVPISFTTASNTDFKETLPQKWLMTTDDSIILNQTDGLASAEGWIIVNVQNTGYYRVNYDTYNWNLLIHQLKSDHTKIHPMNRAQIIGDILNLARAGYVNYPLALSATKYLTQETDYVPWVTALEALEYIDNMLRFTPVYGLWKMYVGKLIEPAYTRIGFFDVVTDSHIKKLYRSQMVKQACQYEVQECIDSAVSLYKQWMLSNGTAILAGNLMEATVCTAVRHGGHRQWEFAWRQYLSTTSSSEREALIKAMACTREPWILLRYLRRSITGDSVIRTNDAKNILITIAKRNPVGKYVAFDFLRDNWEVYLKVFKLGFYLNEIVRYPTITMNTPADLEQLKQFIGSKSGHLGAAVRPLRIAVEKTETNIEWMKNNLVPISMWLEKNT